MKKRYSFETSREFSTSVLILSPLMQHICGFPDCFSFVNFLSFLLLETNFIKLFTKFYITQVKFPRSRCTSTEKLSAFLKKI